MRNIMQLDMAPLSKIPLPETLLNLKDLKQLALLQSLKEIR